jgi:hypothetical protein
VSENDLTNLTKKQASDLIGKAIAAENRTGDAKADSRTQQTLAGLLRGSDDIMQHLNTARAYDKLSEGAKVEAFKALIDAYARMNNTMRIAESRGKRGQEKVTV